MSIISISIVITSRYKSATYEIPISPGVSSLITITSLMAFQLLISFIDLSPFTTLSKFDRL